MKILIIDDEALARESLKMQIEKCGEHAIYETADGRAALVNLREESPDVVFIDIQMPGMSGIEFMERGREICGTAFFVVLSGYNSFEYAQKAIKYSACEYLLKPVSDDSIFELLKKIGHKISEKEQKQNRYQQMYLSEQRQKESLQRKYIYELLNVKRSRRESLIQKIEELGICFDKPYFQIILIRTGNILPSEEELLKFGIRNMAKEIFSAEGQSVELFDDINGIGILLNTFQPLCEETVQNCDETFQKDVSKMFEETNKFCRFIQVNQVTFGIGERKRGIDMLDEAYDSAKQTLNLYLTSGEYKIYFSGKEKKNIENYIDKQEWEKRFSKALFTEDEEMLVPYIEEFYAQYAAGDGMSVKELHKIHLSFFVLLQKLVKRYETEAMSEDEFSLYNKIQKMDSIEEMRQFVLKKVDESFQMIRERPNSGNSKIVYRGKHFIEKNLGNELTLNAVAEYAGVSAVYFSKIFKEEEKKTFIEYVTERRIETACELLESNMKTAEISERIGYHDMKHFYKVFKKYMGVSPSQYRKKVR